MAEDNACHIHLPDQLFQRRLKVHKANIEWSGVAWICTKQLKHYTAFWRTGTTITVHSFVSILAEEESHYLGYLEDMYEDKKGQKKVKVRWLCHNQEVNGIIPQLNPHPREVFLTSHVQVISAECVHGLATVLTPWHYEKCVAIIPHSSLSSVHMCCRQFKENKVKPFALTKLYGYPNQAILSSLDSGNSPMQKVNCHNPNKENRKELTCDDPVRARAKRCKISDGHQGLENRSAPRNVVSGNQIAKCEPAYPKLKLRLLPKKMGCESVASQTQPAPFKVNEKIEFLCQDSGIRGCWFMCQVLHASDKHLKVRYDNVQDADGSGNLEEWVPVSRVAAPCKLGMRCSGRQTIRPRPPKESAYCNVDVGLPVDAWWSDGWWEGIVSGVGLSGDSCLQVYLPGEEKFLIVQQTNVRTSRDWVDNRWVNIKPKPDILCYVSTSCISSASAENKFIKTMKLEAIEEYKPMVSSGVVDAKEVGLRKVTPVNEEDAKAIW
uniref:BAH domain-containing protein n=1 Tax=Rhizophora mucronata TaxID=61149 RepID=A0A2P2IRT7_RHIMU